MSSPEMMGAGGPPEESTSRICLAALLTCYNRRPKTLACLEALAQQKSIESIQTDVYLVDDGCTDGTGAAVRERYPQVNVLQGDGSLYWCGGMRMAFAAAMSHDYDYYLWLNDDTVLAPEAMATLLSTAAEVCRHDGQNGIIVGSCRDPETGKHSYGGRSRTNPEGFITPGEQPQPCDLMNGNIVLIPREVAVVVGNISPQFRQSSGDEDYGLRAVQQGFQTWLAPGFLGWCAVNPRPRWTDPTVPLRERWRGLHDPKGQPPYEIYVFARRHHGRLWFMDLVKLYLRVLFPRFHTRLKTLRRWLSPEKRRPRGVPLGQEPEAVHREA